MFCTRVAWVCLVCLLLYNEEGSSPVSLQLWDMGLHVVLGWGLCYPASIWLVLRTVFNMLVRYESKRDYVF